MLEHSAPTHENASAHQFDWVALTWLEGNDLLAIEHRHPAMRCLRLTALREDGRGSGQGPQRNGEIKPIEIEPRVAVEQRELLLKARRRKPERTGQIVPFGHDQDLDAATKTP